MYCLDTKDGKELWKYQYGQNTRGSPVWGDGKIYVPELDSQFHILKADDKGCKALCFGVLPAARARRPVELTGSPAIADGRVYFLTSEELLCIGNKDRKNKIAIRDAEEKTEHSWRMPSRRICKWCRRTWP